MTPTIRTLVPDELWRTIQPLLPTPPRRYGGRPRIGSPVTCWRRLRDWQRAGVWQQLHHLLLDQLGRASKLDWSRASADSISVRAKRRGR
jgi:transposase